MATYVFLTLAPISRLSSLSCQAMVFFGASVVVVGVVAVVAVVERPMRLHFFGAPAFFCRCPFLAMRF